MFSQTGPKRIFKCTFIKIFSYKYVEIRFCFCTQTPVLKNEFDRISKRQPMDLLSMKRLVRMLKEK